MYGERKRNFVGRHFWARGYFVSTVGRDEVVVREYIKKQKQEDERLDQFGLQNESPPNRWLQECGAALATPTGRPERLTFECPGLYPDHYPQVTRSVA